MSTETSTKEMIAILQAYEQNKPLQFTKKGEERWADLHPFCFGANFSEYDYRIKPEPPNPPTPREWMMALHKDGGLRCSVKLPVRIVSVTDCEIIHVREVLPE